MGIALRLNERSTFCGDGGSDAARDLVVGQGQAGRIGNSRHFGQGRSTIHTVTAITSRAGTTIGGMMYFMVAPRDRKRREHTHLSATGARLACR